MVTKNDVKSAAEDEFNDYGWGVNRSLTIDGEHYPIEWVELIEGHEGDWDIKTKAVFKINLDGKDRLFAKEGRYRSHDGEYWDGPFYEVTPEVVTKTEYREVKVGTLTAKQVEDAINAQEEIEGWDWGYENTLTTNGVVLDVEWVAETGGMDEGSYASHVFKINDQLFKKEGYYASHYGYDWDGDLFEVESFTKTVTDYRRV